MVPPSLTSSPLKNPHLVPGQLECLPVERRDPIAEQYAQLSDDELLKVVQDSSQLTREASVLAYAEMERRGLGDSDVRAYAVGLAMAKRKPAFMIPSYLSRTLRTISYGAGQFAIAALGVSVVAALLFNTLRSTLSPFVSRTKFAALAVPPPYFLFVMAVALLNGYLLSRRRGRFWTHWTAEVVWIFPALWLLLHMLSYHQASALAENRWRHFFWSQDPDSLHAQFEFTLPFLASAMYGVGHLLGKEPDLPT